MTATPAQLKCLRIAVNNGGTIELGGLDRDPVRRDVVYKCYSEGWLEPYYNGTPYMAYKITDKGRDLADKQARSMV